MRNNKFSSASDRRWQRRYERIQQRKDEEQYRKELKEQNEFDQLVNGSQPQQIRYVREGLSRFDISEPIVASAPTFTITIPEPEFDRPNRNGTVISRDVWETAMSEAAKSMDALRQSIVDAIIRIAHGEAEPTDRERVYEYIIEETLGLGHRTQDWFDAFVDVKDIGLGDRAIISADLSLAADIQEAELDTGDTDILDSFLGEFFLQGV